MTFLNYKGKKIDEICKKKDEEGESVSVRGFGNQLAAAASSGKQLSKLELQKMIEENEIKYV